MKKLLWLFAVGIVLGLLLCTVGIGENAENRNLTLMVYMCGSDLESWAGSASLDLREMQEAFQGSNQVSVLVMTGGSMTFWNSDHFQKDTTQIYEITANGDHCVWRSKELLNMGNPETLTTFLAFGKEQYPAKDYALILWDHGSGPLGGVCNDEPRCLFHLKALKTIAFPSHVQYISKRRP